MGSNGTSAPNDYSASGERPQDIDSLFVEWSLFVICELSFEIEYSYKLLIGRSFENSSLAVRASIYASNVT